MYYILFHKGSLFANSYLEEIQTFSKITAIWTQDIVKVLCGKMNINNLNKDQANIEMRELKRKTAILPPPLRKIPKSLWIEWSFQN